MAREHLLATFGILLLIVSGLSQTLPLATNRPPSDTLPSNIGSTEPTHADQPSSSRPPNNMGGGSNNLPVPKIQDQTAETFLNFESAITNESALFASVNKDFKTTLAEALKNLSKIEPSKLDVRPISNEMSAMSTTVNEAYEATDKRFKTSLLSTGRLINNTIAKFVRAEQGYIGKMKLAPDASSISRKLRQIENDFYRGLGACISTFNDSVVSDIFTARNIFNTYFMGIDTLVSGIANCSTSGSCAAFSRTLVTQLANWRSSITVAFNKIPNFRELNSCTANEATTATNILVNLGRTIQPPIDSRAVVTNQTSMLETNANSIFGNFSNNIQKLMSIVLDKINHIDTFASRHARDDPKSIIDSSFKSITSSDDIAVQLTKAILARMTASSRRLIVPLVNKETNIQRQIESTLSKDNAPSPQCDAAIQTISRNKHNFNQSMVACFNGPRESIDAILSSTAGLINGSLSTFVNQIVSAEQFDCGRNCTITALQAFAQQLRTKLEVGASLLAELRKTVTEQANKIYKAFETCMEDSVKKALDDLDEKTNADIKRCLATA